MKCCDYTPYRGHSSSCDFAMGKLLAQHRRTRVVRAWRELLAALRAWMEG